MLSSSPPIQRGRPNPVPCPWLRQVAVALPRSHRLDVLAGSISLAIARKAFGEAHPTATRPSFPCRASSASQAACGPRSKRPPNPGWWRPSDLGLIATSRNQAAGPHGLARIRWRMGRRRATWAITRERHQDPERTRSRLDLSSLFVKGPRAKGGQQYWTGPRQGRPGGAHHLARRSTFSSPTTSRYPRAVCRRGHPRRGCDSGWSRSCRASRARRQRVATRRLETPRPRASGRVANECDIPHRGPIPG